MKVSFEIITEEGKDTVYLLRVQDEIVREFIVLDNPELQQAETLIKKELQKELKTSM